MPVNLEGKDIENYSISKNGSFGCQDVTRIVSNGVSYSDKPHMATFYLVKI